MMDDEVGRAGEWADDDSVYAGEAARDGRPHRERQDPGEEPCRGLL